MTTILRIFPAVFTTVLLYSCSGENSSSPNGDSVPKKKDNDSIVMKGTGAIYARKPDSAYNGLIMGNPESFAAYWRENGASMNEGKDGIFYSVYLTREDKELVTISVIRNKKGVEIPFAIDIRKYDKKPLPKELKVYKGFKLHYMSSNGIYIGMFPENVMTVYTDQSFVRTYDKDTMCLTYRPKEKDKECYTRYPWNKVVVRYKFVDDYLRRIEYYIDPEVFRSLK